VQRRMLGFLEQQEPPGGMLVTARRHTRDARGALMSAYFCPHSRFNSGYLIKFLCLRIDLIKICDYWIY